MTVAEVLQKAIDKTNGKVNELLTVVRDNLLVTQASKRATFDIIDFLIAGADEVSDQAFSVTYDCLYGEGVQYAD